MLTIRLQRVGRKNQPSFRVIVTPKKLGGPAGKPVEYLGWFNPFSKAFELKKERISYWLAQGAKPTETLNNLLLKAGLISGKKIPLHGKERHPEKTEARIASKAAKKAGAEKPKEETVSEPAVESAKGGATEVSVE